MLPAVVETEVEMEAVLDELAVIVLPELSMAATKPLPSTRIA
jgi:hypothetical protein